MKITKNTVVTLDYSIADTQGGLLEVGMQFSKDDGEDALIYEVTQIEDDKVILDANHPFAGIETAFSCTVLKVREATKAEIKEGRPL